MHTRIYLYDLPFNAADWLSTVIVSLVDSNCTILLLQTVAFFADGLAHVGRVANLVDVGSITEPVSVISEKALT